jgi:hypothetical protein
MTKKEAREQRRIERDKRETFYKVMDWIEMAFGIVLTMIGAIYLLSHLPH